MRDRRERLVVAHWCVKNDRLLETGSCTGLTRPKVRLWAVAWKWLSLCLDSTTKGVGDCHISSETIDKCMPVSCHLGGSQIVMKLRYGENVIF